MIKADKNNDNNKERAPAKRAAYSRERTVPVIEERLALSKQEQLTKTVEISKQVEKEEVALKIPYTEESLDIERVPINQYVEGEAPQMRQEGDYTVIPVLKEVVTKRLVLVEEVRIKKQTAHKVKQEQVTLRKENVIVSHKPEAK